MRQTVPALRKAAIVVVAVCSVVGAVFLVWQLGTLDQIGTLSNGHLLGMLALFLLPGATAAAWELDRRAAAKAVIEEPAGEPAVDVREFSRREPTLHAHDPHGPEALPGKRAEASTTSGPGRRRRRSAPQVAASRR